ncbi:hypothetical protein LXL04_001981 [Taraxacum kok-saghyz]
MVVVAAADDKGKNKPSDGRWISLFAIFTTFNISPLSAPLLLHPEISLIRRRFRSSGWFLLSDFRISVYLRLNFFRFFQVSLSGFRNSVDLPPRFPHSVWIYIGFISFLFEISLIRRRSRSRSDSSEAFSTSFVPVFCVRAPFSALKNFVFFLFTGSLKTYVCIGFGNKVLQVSICTATAFGSIYLTANFQNQVVEFCCQSQGRDSCIWFRVLLELIRIVKGFSGTIMKISWLFLEDGCRFGGFVLISYGCSFWIFHLMIICLGYCVEVCTTLGSLAISSG